MPIQTNLWKVGNKPIILKRAHLDSERLLENMIIEEPRLLSEEWMLIGQQVKTGFGGFIDLLAIAPDGSIILIELKKNKTPRDVVAQALDYASWLETLQSEDIGEIYRKFLGEGDLAKDFKDTFELEIDEDEINKTHQIVIVAAQLDNSTERMINYLASRNIFINVIFFQIFENNGEQFISRTWLVDPMENQVATSKSITKSSGVWNGEFYCSFGHGGARSWEDAVKYGFICGGGKSWYSRTLKLLNLYDRVWVNVPATGYVGVGVVINTSVKASEFSTKEGKTIDDFSSSASYHREYIDDENKSEYFVEIEWLDTVSLKDAVKEVGMFGNQNTICKPTALKWLSTVERLKSKFPEYDNYDNLVV